MEKKYVYPMCFDSYALLVFILERISKESDGEVKCRVKHTSSAIGLAKGTFGYGSERAY